MHILKFNLSSNFGYFQDKVNIRNNISYPSIHRPSILGILGAILGLNGFAKIKENNGIEYIKELSSIEVGIVLNSEISYSEVTTNDSTSLNISNTKNRVTQKYENILNRPDYDIFLRISDKILFDRIYSALNSKNFIFEPTLGKSYFFANIKNVAKFSTLDKSELDIFEGDLIFSHSLYPSKLIPDLGGEQYDNLFSSNGFKIGRNFVLPISSNQLNGSYDNFTNFTFNNFIVIEDVLENDAFCNIDNKLIYFFS